MAVEYARLPARPIAALFGVSGLLALVSSVLPGGGHRDVLVLLGASDLVVGVVSWFLPWQRWSAWALLALLVPAFGAIAVGNRFAGLPAQSYGVFFVLVFAAVGLYLPPFTSLWLAPVATAVYLVPIYTVPGDHAAGARSAILTIPVAVMLGELLSRVVRVLQRAQHAEREVVGRLAQAVVTDDLTGIGNRRRGEALLESLRPGDALLLVDVDHFKEVNDSLGHIEGDRVLTVLADYLRHKLRLGDEVARFGGDEFIITARQAGVLAEETAERLRREWYADHREATMSVGVAVHEEDTGSDVTFAHADAALYLAKELGRNQVCVYRAEGRASWRPVRESDEARLTGPRWVR